MKKRLILENKNIVQNTMSSILTDSKRRIESIPDGLCPLESALNLLKLYHSQSCGKCVPCRDGLKQIIDMMEDIVNFRADNILILNRLKTLALTIYDTADCAIGYEAGRVILKTLEGFYEDYESHILDKKCKLGIPEDIPCFSECPAHVNVPGYISLVLNGRNEDAIRLIRKDNPFVSVCAYVCEHPCEKRCRRNIVDAPINICGIKRYAVDNAKDVNDFNKAENTNKKIAVIGGGPGGLTCAYYLSLMGHKVVVYEQRAKLGGMLRYGIPSYRLPRNILDKDINHILSTGVEVKYNISVGKDISMKELQDKYDAVYVSIGAHSNKKLGIEGEEAPNVVSAIQMLRDMGDENFPDFNGKNIIVVGGGNVAMDAVRTSLRLGANVKCVYRRRVADMTAIEKEISEAWEEGCEIIPLMVPDHIELDEKGNAKALYCKKQMVGSISDNGRVSIKDRNLPLIKLDCDYIIVAIGQEINMKLFDDTSLKVGKKTVATDLSSYIPDSKNVFAGGDAVSGPATVIKAVAAGKVAADNIDEFLGFDHKIDIGDLKIPDPGLSNIPACGRIDLPNKFIKNPKGDFGLVEMCISEEEVKQECSRCLRCDHFGYGKFRGIEKRGVKW